MNQEHLFDSYKVTIQVKDLRGGTPKNADMIRGWLMAKAGLEGDLDKAVEMIQRNLGTDAGPAILALLGGTRG